MERRTFLGTCVAAVSGAAAVAALDAAATQAAPRLYVRTLLVDVHGDPVRLAQLAPDTNYLFHYPYAATPCFLLNLGRTVAAPATLRRKDGTTYAWHGGIGPARAVVGFSAICAHKLAYPTREVSFIRYQPQPSASSDARVIHCCADHSVYDPAQGARVRSGPAPQPLAAILLEHDAGADTIHALGTLGAEQFDAFFDKYEFKLAMEYGQGKARRPIGARTTVHELSSYCKQTIRC
jgi:Rieske Fe-S protein